jgi:hypothetical protein
MSVEANERTTSTLFEESYWLDAAAPGAWHESEVVQDGKLIGRLPYVFKKKQGLRLITQPQFTPWLGPWIRPSGGKLTNELSHQHQVLEKLISQLPAYDIAVINCAPEIKNLMALHWAKFRLTTGYTHRLYDLTNEKILWDGLRDTVRRLCRKAEKSQNIAPSANLSLCSRRLSNAKVEISRTPSQHLSE